jgi:MinD superfamily P-loop ATPase
MTLAITSACIECGSCEPFCENHAIDVKDKKYCIDPEKCDSCGTCQEYCPIDGAIADEELTQTVIKQ